MSVAQLITLASISGVEDLPTDFVSRDNYAENIITKLKHNDVIIIEGEEGIGKSTFLQSFVHQNSNHTISHFVVDGYEYSKSYECILDTLYRQIHFLCNDEILPDDSEINEQIYNSLNSQLFRKVKQLNHPLYFVFDGFHHLNKQELENISSLFDNLPLKKSKFIFSGELTKIEHLLKSKNLKFDTLSFIKFSFRESKEYLHELTADEGELKELHELSQRGLPIDLSIIKTACRNYKKISDFLSSDATDKDQILKKQWDKVNSTEQKKILAFVIFSHVNLTCSELTILMDKDIDENLINTIPFIELSKDQIQFCSDAHRKYVGLRLEGQKNVTSRKMIEYYKTFPSGHKSTYNIPELLTSIGDYKGVANFYTLDVIFNIIASYKSISGLTIRFNKALEASNKYSVSYNKDQFRFSLHIASLKTIEKFESWESEIEALLKHDKYDTALSLSSAVFLKEDRLKLLAILAKQIVLSERTLEQSLVDQITILCDEIDFTLIPEKGMEIAEVLIYSCPNIALNLVENITSTSSNGNSFDLALTYMSFHLSLANRKSGDTNQNSDVINSKIKNEKLRTLSAAFESRSRNNDADDIIRNSEKINSPVQRIFLLTNWIYKNYKKEKIESVIEYTLNYIISTSNINPPKSTTLNKIAKPLEYILEPQLSSLVNKFDSITTIINTPTIDHIDLLLKLAKAVYKINSEKGRDRYFDVYWKIDEITDLSIKTDCLCLMSLSINDACPTGELENSISSSGNLIDIIEINIQVLLNNTAYHYQMVEVLVKSYAFINPEFVIKIVNLLNTNERRSYSIFNACISIIESTDFSIDHLRVINTYYLPLIKNIESRSSILVEILDVIRIHENVVELLKQFLIHEHELLNLNDIPKRTYILAMLINIFSSLNIFPEKSELYNERLQTAWENIDVLWRKIEIGFLISSNLFEHNPSLSTTYLTKATELKQSERFSSDSVVQTYLDSVNLTIHAFKGIIYQKSDFSEEIIKLKGLINRIQSNRDKLILWNHVALDLFAAGKTDYFNNIYTSEIEPILNIWLKQPFSIHKQKCIVKISPTLFYNHKDIFFNEFWNKLDDDLKVSSLETIADFILTKIPNFEASQEFNMWPKLEYKDYVDLVDVVQKISVDFRAYGYISYIFDSLSPGTNIKLTAEQKAFFINSVEERIISNFPNPNGVQHDGYKILCQVEVDNYQHPQKPKLLESLLIETRKIANVSDKALVLMIIAERYNQQNTKRRLQIIDEAFKIILSIPSFYDKSLRLETCWEILKSISRKELPKYLRLAFDHLVLEKDGETRNISGLIDAAYRYDSNFGESLLTVLDQDPARKHLKEPMIQKIKNTDLVKEVKDNFSKLDSLNSNQFDELFNNCIIDLYKGKIVAKEIDDISLVLKQVSKYSLTDAYISILYFIENNIMKYRHKPSSIELFESMFQSTFENADLMYCISADNMEKTKSLYNNENIVGTDSPIIKVGEKEIAVKFITQWIENNVDKKIRVIDPYFTSEDLELLKLVKSIHSKITIDVLTGYANGSNDFSNSENREKSIEKYQLKWAKLSNESITASIKIVWDINSNKTPFHDRWYIADNGKSAISIGTSYNGFGLREFQIHTLSDATLEDLKSNIMQKYMFEEETNVGNFELKYERFNLCN